jgi:hypothetical protein
MSYILKKPCRKKFVIGWKIVGIYQGKFKSVFGIEPEYPDSGDIKDMTPSYPNQFVEQQYIGRTAAYLNKKTALMTDFFCFPFGHVVKVRLSGNLQYAEYEKVKLITGTHIEFLETPEEVLKRGRT